MILGFAIPLLCFFKTACADVQTAMLPKPENVSLVTLNTQYILTWDHRTEEGHTVNFTTEYLAKYKLKWKKKKDWTTVCVGPDMHCDLTYSHLHYHGMYLLQVRASTNGLHSDWVQKNFCPDINADLGPPSRVELSSVKSFLELAISHPLTSEGMSMKENVPRIYYRIVYWSRSADPQGRSPKVLDSNSTLVILSGLQAWTWYCVRVQSRYDYYNKASHLTPAECMETQGEISYWLIFLYFLASLAVGFLFVLVGSYVFYRSYGVLKATFYPSIQLPKHIQEYLCDSSPRCDLPRLLSPESEVELFCDRLSICPEAVLLEIHTPPPFPPVPDLVALPSGPEEDSSRHHRQDSGDSGICSSEGVSAQQRGSSGQPIRAEMDSDWKSLLSEQLKLEEMGEERRNEGAEDKEVLDMGV